MLCVVTYRRAYSKFVVLCAYKTPYSDILHWYNHHNGYGCCYFRVNLLGVAWICQKSTSKAAQSPTEIPTELVV